jgi:hypothetical protein
VYDWLDADESLYLTALPLVDLSIARNYKRFTEILCRCLMGGKDLPAVATLVFFAVVDEMRQPERQTDHPDAWEYLYRQGLAHFRSTPEFSDLGKRIPLLIAMSHYFSPATDAMVQLRRAPTTVSLIGRTLLREGRAEAAQIALIARRASIKHVVSAAVAAEKAAPGTVQPLLLRALYRNTYGIPMFMGAHLLNTKLPFVRGLAEPMRRLEAALGAAHTPLVSANDLTMVLALLMSRNLASYTAESALVDLLQAPKFAKIWNSATASRPHATPAAAAAAAATPVSADDAELDAVAVLNQRFQPYIAQGEALAQWLAADPHNSVPSFVTTMGPSVYRCSCGVEFGDPREEVTADVAQRMQTARTAHFRQAYAVKTGAGWYPAAGMVVGNCCSVGR